MADIRPGTQQTSRPASRLTAPPQVRISRPVLAGPAPSARFTPPKPKAPSIFKDNKNFFKKLVSVPSSAIGAIGQGIAALPTLGGKIAQTAYGLGEGIVDLGLDLIDENIYTSRFESDLAKGREMGLEGDALVAYAGHRQYPFGSMIIESAMGTGRRVAELATAGKYDYGTPGIDYATAFREGDLGAMLVEDIGNVILGGRATGAGNIVARGGQTLQATRPRLGTAVRKTGQFIEEPIGTTARETAALAGRRLPTEGRLGAAQGPAARIGQAERPLRQMMNEIGVAWRNRSTTRSAELQKQINDLRTQQEAATLAGETTRASNLQNQIDRLEGKRGLALSGTGKVATGRATVRQGKKAAERLIQSITNQFRQLTEVGPAPETPATYRKRAANLRSQAARALTDQEQMRLNAEAAAWDNVAALKEQFPESMGPLPKWAEEAAILVGTNKAEELARLEDSGFTMDQLVRAAQDPMVDPYLAQKNMAATEDGVRAAIEYHRARAEQGQSGLNPGETFQIDQAFAVMLEYSRLMTEMMRSGFGMPEGPAPFYWFRTDVVPSYLLDIVGQSIYSSIRPQLLAVLDTKTRDYITNLLAQGILDESFLEEFGVKLDEPDGLFQKMVRAGEELISKGDEQPVPYMIAFDTLRLSYKQLRQQFPRLMLNPDIYPATMRPQVIVRRQAIRELTGEDVITAAETLSRVAEEFPDLIDPATLDSIERVIAKAIDPRARVEEATLRQAVARIESILEKTTRKIADLQKKGEQLSTEDLTLQTQLVETELALSSLQNQLDLIASQPPEPSPRLTGAQRRVAAAETETQALLAEKETVQAQDQAARAEQSARLQPFWDRIAAEDARMADNISREETLRNDLGEVERTQAQIQDDLSLIPVAVDNPTALQADFELVVELQGAADTAADARALRAEAIAAAQADVDLLKSQLDRTIGTSKLRSKGNRIDPQTGRRIDEGSLAQEDVAAALWPLGNPSSAMYRAFRRDYVSPDGLPLDELFATDEGGTVFYGAGDAELTAFAELYKQYYEARQRLKEARKSTEQYRGEVLERDLLADPVTGEPLGQTGLSSQQVLRAVELQDAVELNALLDRQKTAARDAARLRTELDNLARERARIVDERGRAEAVTPQLEPVRANPRLGQIDQRLAELRNEQRNALRSLKFAEAAEGKEAAKAERARLRGVGRIGRPEPGAEGPTVGQLGAKPKNLANATIKTLNRQQELNVARLQRVKQNLSRQEALRSELVSPDMERKTFLETELPLGPEAGGPAPLYLPMGAPRSYTPGRSFEFGIRGEGAAPQTRLQATKQRVSSAIPLDFAGLTARIKETLSQQYRNSYVEAILTNPELSRKAGELIGADTVERLRGQAEATVARQDVLRNTAEFRQSVQREFGILMIKELQRRGYEVVSPVRVDPESGVHAPVGDLSTKPRPETVNEYSFVMPEGLAEQLFAEYERKGAREVPMVIARPLAAAGKLTSKWKSHILPLSLRWQVGDALGIVMLAWQRGDIPPQQLATRMNEVIGRLTDPTDPRLSAVLFSDLLGIPIGDPVIAALLANGLQARGLRMEEIAFLERNAEQITPSIEKEGRFKRYDAFRTKAFRLNEAINTVGRAAYAIEMLDRALREKGRSLDEITGPNSIGDPVIRQAITDSVDATNRVLGAFSDLTPWEKQVMRQVFPFWSWLKFINKAAFDLAIDNPDRVLFYAHMGSMAMDPDDMGLSDWLRGKTPIMGALYDLNFMNPYADAILLSGNPLQDTTETFTSISPAIEVPRKILGELTYAATGREYPLLSVVSRPGYLEGRPEASTRGIGDVLGGAAYLGIRGLVPIARNIFDVLPTGRIPGTDIATGPVQRYGQGSLRTTGAYAEPRLSPVTGRVGAVLRTFGIPAPLISQEMAQRQAREQAQRDQAARLRRIGERQRAGA